MPEWAFVWLVLAAFCGGAVSGARDIYNRKEPV